MLGWLGVVPPGLAPLAEVVQTAQGRHVICLSIPLTPSLVIVLDDIVPHVLIIIGCQVTLMVTLQSQNKEDEHCGRHKRWEDM
ncbi:hypothetical protein FKM82_021013 [Ascaphus truei]